MKFIASITFAAACAASASAFAITPADLYGSAVTPAAARRSIAVDSHTRYVNVKHGDIITFTSGTSSVTWNFDGIYSAVPLSKIIPAAAVADDVHVYVEPELIG
jgi:Heavy-metal resistance protein CzcE